MAGGAEYQFVAWTRSGIGALLGGRGLTATIALGANGSATAQLATYGAADVTGLDPRAVIRTVPRNGTLDFEPNLFPSVELAHPALPWLASGAADASGHATPWIALVVVVDGPGVTLAAKTLSIAAPARPANELPMLSQAWAWAHAQALSTEGAPLDTAAFATSSGTARARLVAPRKLAPATKYIACIVPTTPAWTGTETSIVLAVYYAWRFATGPDGDFASLVRRLKPQPLDASVGHRAIDISTPGWGAPKAAGATLDASSVLRSPAWTPPAPPAAAAAIGAAIASELAAPAVVGQPLKLAPPSYGAAATRIDVLATAPAWQLALNEDIAQRIAASAGADVIRGDVDTFVEAAWRTTGDTDHINHTLHLGELAGELARRLGDKHLGSLASDGELLAIARPLAARMKLDPTLATPSATLAATITASAMPQTALSASLRRLGRAAGPIRRQSAATTTGDLLAQIDTKQITGDPPKVLATSAAGFDAVSIATKSTVRLALATPTLIASASTHWTRLTTRAAAVAGARRNLASQPVVGTESSRAIQPLPIGIAQIPIGEKGTIPRLPSKGGPVVQINEFALAARAHQQYITTHLEQTPDTRPPLGDLSAARPLGSIRAAIATQWTAAYGILPILGTRITGITGFTPVVATPVLQQPLIETLIASSPELVMPGFTSLASNRVALAATDPDFVRAFLVGANEQLARELLWRQFPGALGHTWLQTFWGRVEAAADGSPRRVPDIPPIETWPAAGPPATPAMLVLAVRGDVLQRYPNALVYAVAAAWHGSQRIVGSAAPVAPVVATTLGSDVALFGFDLTVAAARGTSTPPGAAGYYFVIAEHPHEPRFGLAATATATPASWSDIAWADVAAADLAGNYLRVDGPFAQRQLGSLRWGADAAQLAAIGLRPTVRVAIHASTLVS